MAKAVTFLDSLCQSNGFSLKEYPLNGRLLMVLLKPTIVIKSSLQEKEKQLLVGKSISHLVKCSCKRAIFWHGRRQFFHL